MEQHIITATKEQAEEIRHALIEKITYAWVLVYNQNEKYSVSMLQTPDVTLTKDVIEQAETIANGVIINSNQ